MINLLVMNGMVGRSLLVVALCLATASSLWGVSLLAGPGDATVDPAAETSQLDAPLPPVAQLKLDISPRSSWVRNGEPGHAPAPEVDPALAAWAAETAPLLGIPEPELISYGVADLVMQERAPACQLSWITVAAVGRVTSLSEQAQGDVPAAVGTAEQLCGGGRDTTTDTGWESAVRSVANDSAHVHRVLAAATTYATAVHSGVPITPAARAAIDFAIDQIGLPYVWGGNGPLLGDSGFDCSGLTKAAYVTGGVTLPRTAHTQYFAFPRLPSGEQLQPGDLVYYGNPAVKIRHVGLYIGNGQMINAPTFGMPVQVMPYRMPGDGFAGANRPAA